MQHLSFIPLQLLIIMVLITLLTIISKFSWRVGHCFLILTAAGASQFISPKARIVNDKDLENVKYSPPPDLFLERKKFQGKRQIQGESMNLSESNNNDLLWIPKKYESKDSFFKALLMKNYRVNHSLLNLLFMKGMNRVLHYQSVFFSTLFSFSFAILSMVNINITVSATKSQGHSFSGSNVATALVGALIYETCFMLSRNFLNQRVFILMEQLIGNNHSNEVEENEKGFVSKAWPLIAGSSVMMVSLGFFLVVSFFNIKQEELTTYIYYEILLAVIFELLIIGNALIIFISLFELSVVFIKQKNKEHVLSSFDDKENSIFKFYSIYNQKIGIKNEKTEKKFLNKVLVCLSSLWKRKALKSNLQINEESKSPSKLKEIVVPDENLKGNLFPPLPSPHEKSEQPELPEQEDMPRNFASSEKHEQSDIKNNRNNLKFVVHSAEKPFQSKTFLLMSEFSSSKNKVPSNNQDLQEEKVIVEKVDQEKCLTLEQHVENENQNDEFSDSRRDEENKISLDEEIQNNVSHRTFDEASEGQAIKENPCLISNENFPKFQNGRQIKNMEFFRSLYKKNPLEENRSFALNVSPEANFENRITPKTVEKIDYASPSNNIDDLLKQLSDEDTEPNLESKSKALKFTTLSPIPDNTKTKNESPHISSDEDKNELIQKFYQMQQQTSSIPALNKNRHSNKSIKNENSFEFKQSTPLKNNYYSKESNVMNKNNIAGESESPRFLEENVVDKNNDEAASSCEGQNKTYTQENETLSDYFAAKPGMKILNKSKISSIDISGFIAQGENSNNFENSVLINRGDVKNLVRKNKTLDSGKKRELREICNLSINQDKVTAFEDLDQVKQRKLGEIKGKDILIKKLSQKPKSISPYLSVDQMDFFNEEKCSNNNTTRKGSEEKIRRKKTQEGAREKKKKILDEKLSRLCKAYDKKYDPESKGFFEKDSRGLKSNNQSYCPPDEFLPRIEDQRDKSGCLKTRHQKSPKSLINEEMIVEEF